MIARIWAATSLASFGLDSFHEDFKQDVEVVKEVQHLSKIIIGDNPYIHSLDEIISYVTKNVK